MLGSVGEKDFIKETKEIRESISETIFTKFETTYENNYYKDTMLNYIDKIIHMNEEDIFVQIMMSDLKKLKDDISKYDAIEINKMLLGK